MGYFVDTNPSASLNIPPAMYLLDDFNSNSCRSLIIENSEETLVFGKPFFRAYNVVLNFNTTEITIIEPTAGKQSPIDSGFPEPDNNYTHSVQMTVNDYNQYGGSIFVGNDYQGGSNYKIAYDT